MVNEYKLRDIANKDSSMVFTDYGEYIKHLSIKKEYTTKNGMFEIKFEDVTIGTNNAQGTFDEGVINTGENLINYFDRLHKANLLEHSSFDNLNELDFYPDPDKDDIVAPYNYE